MVQWADMLSGLFSVGLLPQQNPRRRKLYGRAGEYRWTSYKNRYRGLEYRVHSSWVLAHPAVFHLICELTRGALCMALSGLSYYVHMAYADLLPSTAETRRIINTCDAAAARQVIQKMAPLYDLLLARLGVTDDDPQGADFAKKTLAVACHPKGINAFADLSKPSVNWRFGCWTHHSGTLVDDGNCCSWKYFVQNRLTTEALYA